MEMQKFWVVQWHFEDETETFFVGCEPFAIQHQFETAQLCTVNPALLIKLRGRHEKLHELKEFEITPF